MVQDHIIEWGWSPGLNGPGLHHWMGAIRSFHSPRLINILLTMTYCHVHNFNVNKLINSWIVNNFHPQKVINTPRQYHLFHQGGLILLLILFIRYRGDSSLYGGLSPSFVESRLPPWGVKGRLTQLNPKINVCIV
jgi:hypothetical protein